MHFRCRSPSLPTARRRRWIDRQWCRRCASPWNCSSTIPAPPPHARLRTKCVCGSHAALSAVSCATAARVCLCVSCAVHQVLCLRGSCIKCRACAHHIDHVSSVVICIKCRACVHHVFWLRVSCIKFACIMSCAARRRMICVYNVLCCKVPLMPRGRAGESRTQSRKHTHRGGASSPRNGNSESRWARKKAGQGEGGSEVGVSDRSDKSESCRSKGGAASLRSPRSQRGGKSPRKATPMPRAEDQGGDGEGAGRKGRGMKSPRTVRAEGMMASPRGGKTGGKRKGQGEGRGGGFSLRSPRGAENPRRHREDATEDDLSDEVGCCCCVSTCVSA
jgi:hypothetical protein